MFEEAQREERTSDQRLTLLARGQIALCDALLSALQDIDREIEALSRRTGSPSG